MNLPIPTHLQPFLSLIGNENSEFEVTGTIHCSCGGKKFEVWESNGRCFVKLICKQCGKEILLFDSGRHGWEGFVCHDDFLDRAEELQKFICTKCNKDVFDITVHISSQGKQDFIDECVSNDDSFSADDWVNGFDWITISLSCLKCDFEETAWLDLETM